MPTNHTTCYGSIPPQNQKFFKKNFLPLLLQPCLSLWHLQPTHPSPDKANGIPSPPEKDIRWQHYAVRGTLYSDSVAINVFEKLLHGLVGLADEVAQRVLRVACGAAHVDLAAGALNQQWRAATGTGQGGFRLTRTKE